jgi:hypothetical protein
VEHEAHYERILAAYDALSEATLAYLEALHSELAAASSKASPDEVLIGRLSSTLQQVRAFDELLQTDALDRVMDVKRGLFLTRMAREGRLI